MAGLESDSYRESSLQLEPTVLRPAVSKIRKIVEQSSCPPDFTGETTILASRMVAGMAFTINRSLRFFRLAGSAIGWLTAFLTLIAGTLRAQESGPDAIHGRVTDDSSRAIVATIMVTRGPDRLTQQTTTDSAGNFRVRFDPGTGDYLVYVSATGFTPARRRVQRQTDEHDLVANSDVLVMDATGNGWHAAEPMPTARNYARAAVIGNSIYLVGGNPVVAASHSATGSTLVERFQPSCPSLK